MGKNWVQLLRKYVKKYQILGKKIQKEEQNKGEEKGKKEK
jgi:hypothetical protein